jgi:hypothetical protein
MSQICDHGQCPATARVRVDTRCGPVFLCGHHYRRAAAALERGKYDTYDLRTGRRSGHERGSAPDADDGRGAAGAGGRRGAGTRAGRHPGHAPGSPNVEG